jgi:hypothetical protein
MISEEDTDRYLAEVLEILRQEFDGGDKSALLKAIYYWCLMNRPYGFVEAPSEDDGKPSDEIGGAVVGLPQFRPLPEWLRLAFLAAYESRARFEIKSWDEVFDQPVPKGTQLEKEKLRRLVIERVWALKTKDPEMPIDRGLFDQIGEELGIPGSTIDGLYYDERSRWLREIYEITHRLFGTPEKN